MSRLDTLFLENTQPYALTKIDNFIYLTIYNENTLTIENYTFDSNGNEVTCQ